MAEWIHEVEYEDEYYCSECGHRLQPHELLPHLRRPNKCPECETFIFDYGVVTFKHRLSIHRSLEDYEEITLNRCMRMGIVYKYKTIGCDKPFAEMQISYKDENGKLRCLCEDLHDFTFSIKHKGDMQIDL